MSASWQMVRWLVAALAAAGLSGCVTVLTRQTVEPVEAVRADRQIPEAALLDVGIQVFEPSDAGAEAVRGQATDPKVVDAEARFIPFHLKKTLQQTGQWGATRVVPARAEEVDVTVSGKLLESNGEVLRIEIRVVDATGRVWLHKEYAAEATAKNYEGLEKKQDRDPFQDLYNQVANDMLAYREGLDAKEIAAIRQVASLKFARSMVPQAFATHLVQDDEGRSKVNRLPADSDPMYERVARIRTREYMFIDTVNVYYGNLYDEMRQPYTEWRKAYLAELTQQRALERKVWALRALGVAAIIGAAALGGSGDSSASQAASTLLILGGYEALRSGQRYANDARVHEASLKELAVSFKADVAPVVEEVEGRTIKLSGSVDTQYAEWRKTLRELLAVETGSLPVTTPGPQGPSPEPQRAR
jgi:hypothetical protein